MASIEYGAVTHAGQRPANEDMLRGAPEDSRAIERGHLFAVADGLGGHKGGGLASRLACQGLDDYYQRRIPSPPPWSPRKLSRHLEETVLRIDRHIRRLGLHHAALADMGTTLSCLVVTRGHTIVAHVGDSRIYRLRRGHLTCMTSDHTFLQEMIFEGEVDVVRAADHPLRHLLTRVVGTAEPLPWVDTRVDPLFIDDRFLLCTDGLHNHLTTKQLETVMSKPWHARRIALTLVTGALDAGARDNITAVVIRNDGKREP